MKLFTITTCFFSLIISNIYISYDLSASVDGELRADGQTLLTADLDYDSGALAVGYESSPQSNIAYGLSYDILGMDYDGAEDGDAHLNIYGKYFGQINNDVSLWASVGYNVPQLDIEDYDGGLSYGLGFQHSSGIGAGYQILNYSYSEYIEGVYAELEGNTSRISIYYIIK